MITARDRKIILVLIPLLLAAGYWFMVLAPKRAESQKVAEELAQAQSERDAAEQQVAQLNAAKASFSEDYATVIRLGKAVPTTLDMPSLLVQLDRAARGTGIDIYNFKPGPAGGSSGSAPPASAPTGGGSNPAAQGAPPAASGPGQAAQAAGGAVNSSNDASASGAGEQGGAQGATPGAPTAAPGLTAVPLTFTMAGSYFDLADFFHRMKRFVRVVNDQIVVRGRLMTVEGFSFENTGPDSPVLKADVTATIYLTPASEGTTAGATEQGPAGAPPASGASSTPSSTPPTPTAAATTP